MIEKISPYNDGKHIVGQFNNYEMGEKINELVDAVNNQQIQLNNHECRLLDLHNRIATLDDPTYHEKPAEIATISKMENVAENGKFAKNAKNLTPGGRIRIDGLDDLYAEQRKWIGKLCRFWDGDAFVTSNDWAFGILTGIDKGMQYQYCCEENCNFKHCEPVKPDDDIIFKGE